MVPPEVLSFLNAVGHDAVSPVSIGDPRMSDEEIVDIASAEGRIIVTENTSDFAPVTTCTVVFALKAWWPPGALAARLAHALDRWATANPDPGEWPYWLDAELR